MRLSRDGEILSARRSPKRGRPEDVFARLVSLPALLARPGFELEVLLTHEDEFRRHEAGRAFRRHGWVVAGRALRSVEQTVRLSTPDEAAALLPQLPERFDTAELAAAGGVDAPAGAADDVLPACDGGTGARRAPRARRALPARVEPNG